MKKKAGIETVDAYIASQPESTRAKLQEIRQLAPEAKKLISYQMPGYRFHGKLISQKK